MPQRIAKLLVRRQRVLPRLHRRTLRRLEPILERRTALHFVLSHPDDRVPSRARRRRRRDRRHDHRPRRAFTLKLSPPSVYAAMPSATPYTIGDASSTRRVLRNVPVTVPRAARCSCDTPFVIAVVDRELRARDAADVHAAVLHELLKIHQTLIAQARTHVVRLRERRDVRRLAASPSTESGSATSASPR